MKKILALLLSAVTLFTLISCNSNVNDSDLDTDTVAGDAKSEAEKEENIIVPPTRVTKDKVRVCSYVNVCKTMEELYEESDVIAYIRVKNWLGDATQEEYSGVTCFEAEVLELYKGDIEDEFVLTQMGTSTETIEGFPLFTYGKEMLVFLYNPEDGIEHTQEKYPDYPDFEYDNAYGLVGGSKNIWHATKIDGQVYMVPREESAIKDDMVDAGAFNKCDAYTTSKVIAALKELDTVDNPGSSPNFVVKVDDLINYIATYCE